MNAAIDSLLAYAGVEAGDRVLLALDPDAPPHAEVLRALEAALAARGAAAARKAVAAFEPRLSDVPPSFGEAMAASDVVVDLAGRESLPHAATPRRLVRERGLRLVAVSLRGPDDWATPFATTGLERLFARSRAAASRLAPGGRSRITARNGTDLSIEVRPRAIVGMPGGAAPAPLARGRGGFGLFPAGAVGTSPVTSEGTVVLDGLVGFRGPLARPVRLRVEGGHVRDVEGGPEASWLRERIAARENGGFVAKVLAGLHPAAPVDEGLRDLARGKARLSRAEGVLLVGLGDARGVGGDVASTWHWDGVVVSPVDWDADGRPLFRAGTLQALPEATSLSLAPAPAHAPRLVARAGELGVFQVDCRGPMPHAHRNAESDELWLALDGASVRGVDVDGGTSVALEASRALLVPRGLAHRADGHDRAAPVLVVERLAPARPVEPGERAVVPLDVAGLFSAPTPPWTRPHPPLASTPSLVVEGYSRPEGMLRPAERVGSPEAWVVLRGAVKVEHDGGEASVAATAPAVVTVPEGAVVRVVSTSRDTVALRVGVP